MMQVHFHPEAQSEYEAAIRWYYSRSPGAASRFEAEVERVSELIADNPQLYPSFDDEHRFAVLRRFPYTLVDSIPPQDIYIIAVAHSSRSPGYWLGRI